MKSHAPLLHVGAGLSVAVALGLLLSSCGSPSPNAPTTPPAGSLSGSAPGTSSSFSGTTTSWSCLTAGSAGIFASATGCGASGINAMSQGRVSASAAPGPSVNLSGSVNGSTVTLNWLAPTSPDPATSYLIEAGSSSGATNIAVFDTRSSATTLTVSDVPAGTYYVRVRASNSAGSSAPSNEVVLTVGGGPAPCTTLPEAPTGLGATVSGTSLTLRWSAPAAGCPPLGYRIEAGSTPGATDFGSFSSNGTSTSFAASNVPAGIYYVRVRGGNVSSLGAPSNEVVVSVAVEREPAGSVTGRWVGLVANGDGVTGNPDPMCGIERFDWQLDLTQSGSTVTGTLTQTTVVSTCEPPGTVKVAALTGTAGPGTFSFSIGPSRNVSATYTASRMTGSSDFGGTFVLNRR